jgi:hypothetical protein
MTTDRVVYVYAIVEHASRPRLPRRAGVPGASPPRALALGHRRWAIVADVAAAEFAPEAVRARLADLEWVSACALGHERVSEALVGARAVAPMRLFAVFQDESTVSDRLQRIVGRLDRTLAGLRGRIEVGLRIGVVPRARPARRRPVTGTDFLAERAARLERPDAPTPAQARGASTLVRELTALADRTRNRRVPAGSGLVRSVQFLVPRTSLRKFGAAVNRRRPALRGLGLEVKLLGPYPAYSFVN